MSNNGVGVQVARLVHIYHADDHDVAALSGVDLAIEPGTTMALLGPSGAGKSTLLTLIAGLASPTAGTITVGDTRIDQLSDRAMDELRGRQIGLVLQGGARNLLPNLTTRQNIELARWSGTDDTDPVALLELMQLPAEVADRKVADLTPAQAQLTALCVGISGTPGLLLADEPTASLGPEGAQIVIDALHRINETLGTTILVVTHDASVAAAMQRTVTIRDGRVGSHGRDGIELAVVAPDGSLPLPDDVLAQIPAGSLVQVEATDQEGRFVISAWQAKDDA